MALPTALPLQWLPSAALGVSVTPSGSAWANSSWVQVSASTGGVWTLYGINVGAGAANGEFEVDIGVGTAGSETVVTTIRGAILTLAGFNNYQLNVPMGPIASGSRVAVRLRTAGTTTTAWRISVGYYQGTFDSTHVTTFPQVPAPSAANGVSLTPNASSWTNSSYVELLTSAATDIVINALPFVPAGTGGVPFEIDIATGASGSETVLHTTRGRYDSAAGYINNALPVPVKVTSGSRVAVRLRKGNTDVTAWKMAMAYQQVSTGAPSFTRTHTTDVNKRAVTLLTHTTDVYKRNFTRSHSTDVYKLPGSTTATPAFVQQTTGNSAGTPYTMSLSVTSGNRILIIVDNQSGTPTFSDTQGNTYTQLRAYTAGSPRVFYFSTVATATGTNVVTVTPTSTSNGVYREYSGTASASPVDIGNDATGSNSVPTMTTSATTQANDMLVVAVGASNTYSSTAGTGFGNYQASAGQSTIPLAVEDRLAATATTYTAAFTGSSFFTWFLSAIALKAGTTVSNRPQARRHTTDTYLRVSVPNFTRTHSTDVYKRQNTFRPTHTTDTLKRKAFTKTHTTDVGMRPTNILSTLETFQEILTQDYTMPPGANTTYQELQNTANPRYYQHRYYWDPSKWDGVSAVYFESMLGVDTAAGTVSVQLWNVTDNVAITGSTLSQTDTVPATAQRSGDISANMPSSPKILAVYSKNSNTSMQGYIETGRLIVQQGSTATKFEQAFELNQASHVNGTTTPYVDVGSGLWLYEASKFNGVVAINWEVNLAVQGTSETGTADLWDYTTGSVVASVNVSSPVNTTNNTITNVTGLLTDGHEYCIRLTSGLSTSGRALSQSGSRIRISQQFATKTQMMLTGIVAGLFTATDNDGAFLDPGAFDSAYGHDMFAEMVYVNNDASSNSTGLAKDAAGSTHANSSLTGTIGDTLMHRTRNSTAMTWPATQTWYRPFDITVTGTGAVINVWRAVMNIYVKTSYTRTHTTDVYKRSSFTRSHTTDVLKRKVITRTHTTDVNKRAVTLRTHTTDTLKRGAYIRSHSTDVLKRKQFTKTHTTDTLKRGAYLRSHTTDTLKRGAYIRSHTTDVMKHFTLLRTHTTDVLKRAALTRTHSTDVNKRAVTTRSHSTDVLKRGQYLRTHSTDVNKRKVTLRSHTTDVNKRAVTLRTHTTDVLKRAVFTRAHSTDVLKRAAVLRSHTTDVLKRAAFTRTHSTDVLKRKQAIRSHTTDVNKRAVTLRSHTTDTLKRATSTRSHTTDVMKHFLFLRSHTTDVLKRAILTRAHTTDVMKHFAFTRTHSTDTYLKRAYFRMHTTDVNKRKVTIQVHTTDVLKRGVYTRTHSTDVLKRKAFTKTHTTDVLKRNRSTLAHSTDALKRGQYLRTHTTDVNKRAVTLRTHTTDTLKRKVTTRSHSTDVFGYRRLTRAHSTDVLKRATTTRSHSTDVFRYTSNQRLHSTDVLKRGRYTRSHTTDVLKRSINTRFHTTDTLKRKTNTRSHTTDVFGYRRLTRFHTTDIFAYRRFNPAHTTDTLKRGRYTRSHSTDTLLLRGARKTHTTDVLMRGRYTRSHSTDVLKLARKIRTHTTDVLKRLFGSRSHSTDVLKRTKQILQQTTDTLKRGRIGRTHTTDVLKRQGFFKQHSTDVAKTKRGSRSHTTDVFKRERVYKGSAPQVIIQNTTVHIQNSSENVNVVVEQSGTQVVKGQKAPQVVTRFNNPHLN